MPGTTNTRVASTQLDADVDTYSALKAIPNYNPHNPRHTRSVMERKKKMPSKYGVCL